MKAQVHAATWILFVDHEKLVLPLGYRAFYVQYTSDTEIMFLQV